MNTTLGEVLDAHDAQVLDHLDKSVEVPVNDGLQFQGDLAVVPIPGKGDATLMSRSGGTVPAAGIAVIAPVGAGHEHRLFAGEPHTAFWESRTDGRDGQVIGVLECTEAAYLIHPEHGATGIAPGRYELRRQREQADEQRLIAD